MSDLVNELRQGSLNKDDYRWRAADRIEQLEAELTIQYQDGHHDGYEKGCTISKEASERYDRIDARIEQLEAALAMFVCDCTVSERCAVPDNCRNFKARRMLEGKP